MAQSTDSQLFVGLTAWFSSSVRKSRTNLWKDEGGEITLFDKVQFVFSDDAETPDTKQLFETEAYLQEHLSIFHSMYIERCVELGDVKQVVLGEYFLPPLDIQNLVRKQMHYKWEVDKPEMAAGVMNGPLTEDEIHEKGRNEEIIHTEEHMDRGANHENQHSDDPVDIETLTKYEGPLEEFVTGKNGCELFCLQ